MEKKRLNIELEPKDHREIKKRAVEKDMTITQWVIEAISEKIYQEKQLE